MNATINSVILGVLLTSRGFGQSAIIVPPRPLDLPARKDNWDRLLATASDSRTRVAITSRGRIAISANSDDWTEIGPGFTTFLRGVTWGNGLFVAVGGSYVDVPGVILISPDGFTWTRCNLDNRINLYGVVYGGGLYLAVGDNDTILTSKDAVSWKRQNSRTSGRLFSAVAYGDGTFIVVGDSGVVLSSTNGSEWRRQNSGTSAYLNRVFRGKGVFEAEGSDLILISTNGTNWSRHYFAIDVRPTMESLIEAPAIVESP